VTAYYNEIDPYAAQWLRNLIAAGLIAAGEVDERSIKDVQPDDLAGFTQCHFFAGIGGWSYALRLAGWADDRPVWTGSCPCQPFSVAGFQRGFDDPRHLWPDWRRLVAKRNPPVVFGEQVAGASGWLCIVRSDLEAMGYAVGAIPIEAASCAAEHFRDRYWFVAHDDQQLAGQGLQRSWEQRRPSRDPQDTSRSLVDSQGLGWGEGWTEDEFRGRGFAAAVVGVRGRQYVECANGKWRALPPPGVRWLGTRIPARVAKLRAFGNAIDPRPAAEFIGAYMETQP
jgi:DNA (cytosine-5)-methyltransferase 1